MAADCVSIDFARVTVPINAFQIDFCGNHNKGYLFHISQSLWLKSTVRLIRKRFQLFCHIIKGIM